MQREDLIGTYRLVSFQHPAGSHPFGEKVGGFITYGADGRMSVVAMQEDRTLLGRPISELVEVRKNLNRPWRVPWGMLLRYLRAAASFVSYAGTYEVIGEDVVHHVEAALVPDWVGTNLVRHVSLDGATLTLRSDEGDLVIWERLPLSTPPGTTERIATA